MTAPAAPCVALAPMAGVTDIGMRRLALQFGASWAVSEMVAANFYLAADEETRLRAEGADLPAHVVQIAARDPAMLAQAARLAEDSGAHAIDINMGCPAKRVVGGYAGSALMREPALAISLVKAAVQAVKIPVSVKMRLGWDEATINAPALASACEQEGAALLIIHGRTRQQFYRDRANWSAIRAVSDAVAIPVLANGDCKTIDDARQMLAQSRADGVMIGRAAIGRPWLAGKIAAGLAGRDYHEPTPAEKANAAQSHYQTLLSVFGRAQGGRHARKHLAAYADCAREEGFGLPPDARARLVTTQDCEEAMALLGKCWLEQTSPQAGRLKTPAEERAA